MESEIRVASVPADHVYVRHLSALEPDGVVRLPDPPTERAGQWWPPRMLDPEWVAAHADDFDLMHIHFGFDAQSPQQLRALVEALRAAGKPLVLTTHDLRNPHHADSAEHDAQLDVLIPAAARVLTLTPGAAAAIKRRWGVDAVVTPHPHVFEFEDIARPRPERSDFVIGVHCKSLRASMDPGAVIDAIVRDLPELPGARLVVDAHNDIMSPDFIRYEPALADQLRRLESDGAIELHVHDFYSDDELRDYFWSLDLSVLPYKFGTHSGWAEACYDLGTGVLAPDCGFYAEQLECFVYHRNPDGSLDRPSFSAALREAYESRGRHPHATVEGRRAQRSRVAEQHRAVYAGLLSA